ncbi:MAG: DNA mismatch repair endonuclease MutL [Candidatus Babeliales bacterium]|nr:DNA mismatch repair endonuclease MutL [Candidatus Babeliales bacterium]
MQKIKKLIEQEARKIAAGEVVERSANIVKELVENSIDSGATNIFIWINEAGKKLIRIVDNGSGMSNADARICFERHATSKITTIEDLNALSTFGFRGEALSSISSISKISMLTKLQDDQYGTSVELEDGQIIKEEQVSCPQGTDISVKDLFYNVPARLKFLKQDETEWRQIVNLYQALCLSYKTIHFKLFNEDKLVYNCPPTDDLKNRLVQLWDHNFAQNTITFSDSNQVGQISGLISNHHFFRYNRGQIFFFVNGRWIKNNGLSKSLLKGYLNVLPQDRFPAAFIFLTIDPAHIDVNIHPRKEDVQFLNAKKIEKLIKDSTKKTLENHLSNQIIKNDEVIAVKLAAQTTFDFEQIPFLDPLESYASDPLDEAQDFSQFNPISQTKTNYQFTSNSSQIRQGYEEQADSYDGLMGQQIQQQNEFPQHNLDVQDKLDKKDYELIGQFNKTYILLEKSEGIFIIDQHAAHERILYELFAKRFYDVATTRLIFPQVINLTEENLNLLVPYLELLHNNGIDCKQVSKEQLIIESTPVYLKDISLEDLIKQFASWIEEYQVLDKQVLFRAVNEKLHAQMACKAAVKAGDKLTHEQIYKLLEDLNKTENRFACPHGRPTGWLMSTHDIEKKFKRRF